MPKYYWDKARSDWSKYIKKLGIPIETYVKGMVYLPQLLGNGLKDRV